MTVSTPLQDKVRACFQDMTVYKHPSQNKFFSSLSIPPYLRDWIIMRFADESGRVDLDEVRAFVKKNIPGKRDWELLKSSMINDGQRVRLLAKLRVELDVRTGEALFSLPDLGFPRRKHEAVVSAYVVRQHRNEVLTDAETWGVIECEWSPTGPSGKERDGVVYMTDFKPFQPYQVDVEFYQEARKEFTL
ncbi:MAG: anti-phage BREX system Lon protease BrxL, partial [Bacillota bacterium]